MQDVGNYNLHHYQKKDMYKLNFAALSVVLAPLKQKQEEKEWKTK